MIFGSLRQTHRDKEIFGFKNNKFSRIRLLCLLIEYSGNDRLKSILQLAVMFHANMPVIRLVSSSHIDYDKPLQSSKLRCPTRHRRCSYWLNAIIACSTPLLQFCRAEVCRAGPDIRYFPVRPCHSVNKLSYMHLETVTFSIRDAFKFSQLSRTKRSQDSIKSLSGLLPSGP